MKKIIFVSMIFLLLGCCGKVEKSAKPQIVSEKDSIALRYLKEVEWPKAYREQDTVLLDRLLGDDFQMIDANGNWFTKADELEWIKENATRNDSFWYEIKRLDILPNGTAIVSGTGHIFKDSAETIYQSSNVLIKRDSLWKAVVSHVSGVKPNN